MTTIDFPYNKECPLMGCADRLKQLEFKRELDETKRRNDVLHQQMEVVQNTLKQRDDSLKKMIEDLLRNVKVKDGEKVLEMYEINNVVEDVAKKMSDEKMSGVIQTNMQMHQDTHRLRLDVERFKQDAEKLREELQAMKEEQMRREQKEIQLIRQHQQSEGKHADLLKENEDMEIQVRNKQNHLKAMQENLEDMRKEIGTIKQSYDEFYGNRKKLMEEIEFYEKNLSHYKGYMTWAARRVNGLITDGLEAHSNGRMDKARKVWLRVQEKYLYLSEPERKLILKQYDELMKVMGQ